MRALLEVNSKPLPFSACGEEHVRWVVSFPKLDHILRWIWDSMGCFEEVQIRFV